MQKIIEIPEKVVFNWDIETKSIIASWSHFFVDEKNFHETIKIVLKYAKDNQAIAWIVDASEAKSLFKHELFEKIKNNILPKLYELGIKYYLTISPKDNSFAKITESKYIQEIINLGITNKEFDDVESSIAWLKTKM